MTIETSTKPRRSGRWLLVAALVLGGFFFLGQYLVMAGMALLRLFPGTFHAVVVLDFLYYFTVGLLDFLYYFAVGLPFSNPAVYWGMSALVLGLAVLAWVWGHPSRAARVALLLVLLLVVATPLVRHYRPAVKAQPGVTMRVLTLPSFWESPSKAIGVGAEVRRCAYALRGWDDSGNLYYTETCGQRVYEWRYMPATDTHTRLAQPLPDDMRQQIVERPTDRVTARLSNDETLLITVREPVLRSPDGAWDAFVSRYIYGPEDVVVVAAGEQDL